MTKQLTERGRFGKTGGKHRSKLKGRGPAFCSKCGSHTIVVDTRHQSGYLRRRRECLNKDCKVGRFTTVEISAPDTKRNEHAITSVMRVLQRDALSNLIAQLQGLLK